MITLEFHPAVPVRERQPHPAYSTCRECRHTFYARNEDQFSLTLCDSCLEDLRNQRPPVISVHVRPRPRRVPD